MPLMLAEPTRVSRSTFALEREGHRALDGVGALADRFRDDVAGAVGEEDIVAEPADHGVVAGAAVERVVAALAAQRVVAAKADQGVVAVGAGQRVGLDIAVEPDRGGGDGARQDADAAGGAVVLGLVDEGAERGRRR